LKYLEPPCSDLVSAFSVEDDDEDEIDSVEERKDLKKRKICKEMNVC